MYCKWIGTSTCYKWVYNVRISYNGVLYYGLEQVKNSCPTNRKMDTCMRTEKSFGIVAK